MHFFYTPDLSSDTYTLDEQESRHCTKVLRLQKGDVIFLADGKGNLHKAEIIDPAPKNCSVKIIDSIKEYGKRNFHLHIAIAPPKNTERFEWFLEKATEMGIDEITPLICQHSERSSVKTERLNKVLISAVKQSLKAYLPRLNEPIMFSKFISGQVSTPGGTSFNGQKFIAHCKFSEPFEKKAQETSHLKNSYQRSSDALILIGPEGDFSNDELILAKEKGFQEISLGNSRLRTETAGIAACSIVNAANE